MPRYVQPIDFPDLATEFQRGRARNRAQGGDWRGASQALAGYDDEASNSYATRARFEDENQRAAYTRDFSRALAGGEYGAAQKLAGEIGPEAVSLAREGRVEATEQERLEAWRTLRAYAQEIEGLAQSPDPQGGYEALLARALESSAQSPELVEQIQRMPRDYPTAQRVVPGILNTWMERLLTPAELARIERESADRQLNERRVAAAERQAEAAMIRAERGPASAQTYGPEGLTNAQINIEDRLSQRWMPIYNNFAEIRDSWQRIQTTASQRNSAGDLALVVAFTKMLDPGSVAREGEVTLTRSAASALAQAQNYLPRLARGNTLLPDSLRAQFVQVAQEMYGNYQRAYDRLARQTRDRALTYGAAPDRVMLGYEFEGEEAGPGSQDAPPMPPINQRVVGQPYTMPNGDTAVWNGESFD